MPSTKWDHSEFKIIKLGENNTVEHTQLPLLTKPIKQQESFICSFVHKVTRMERSGERIKEQNFEAENYIGKETTS